ncbi:hypothetical protein Nepgr_017649 [Nepenthes gracilis]|uniref:Uncharacterized protein n=1 Tax=Nepenthes gracilis TaxID=150966 RepID=A0AAD3XSN9_NEPGR|nr:hypothetical protein Nepgr_017649 [Nepenthes gracilis]
MADLVNEGKVGGGGCGAAAAAAEAEEEKVLLEGMAVLDFDMLCSTVALQNQGKWRLMWEGEVLDCFDDHRIAIESACCPCYRFGKNMRRAGFGSCLLQGIVYLILAVSALLNCIAFTVTRRHYFLYLGIAISILLGMYLGFFRTRIKKKFKIRGSDSPIDDCVYHLICPCCTICQESRTLEMNNVEDGTWLGRGDAICISTLVDNHKVFVEPHIPLSPIAAQTNDPCETPKCGVAAADPDFPHTGMTTAVESGTPARVEGKWTAVFVCWILGFGSLVAWNSMLTISDYYYQVFPNYHPSRVLVLMYEPFAVGTMAILAYNESRIDTRWRNIAGYCLFFLSSLLCIIVDLATSGKGSIGAYVGICVLSAAFGVADAHVQGGMVGDLSFMLPEFMQSFFAGLAASGAVTSGLRLVTKAAFDKSNDGLRKGAMLFLAISTLMEFFCIFLYAYYFSKIPIVKYFRSKAASEGSKTVSADLAAAGIHKTEEVKHEDRLSLKQLLYQNIDYAIDLFLIYVLTLSIFPGFLYENTGTHHLGSWYSLVLIAMYNVCDLIARYTPLIDFLRIESRKGLATAVAARFLFIPAFYFTAKYADEGWMIMLVSFLGLSNGHLTVCVMTAAPKGYKGPEQNALGNLLVLFLLGGLFTGASLDWLWLIGKGSF